IADAVSLMPPAASFIVLDPFAGPCNTLYWVLRHVPRSRGIGFEMALEVFELTRKNVSGLDRTIELNNGDYASLLMRHDLPPGHAIVVFVAPPWAPLSTKTKGWTCVGPSRQLLRLSRYSLKRG